MGHIREFIQQCTNALSNDPQVRLEIEQELADHLENKVAEERSTGMSEVESEERAIKAFGDAPEISEALYSANFRRMKLHAKIRLFIKVAAIPALLLTMYFAFDFRNVIFSPDFNTIELPKYLKSKNLTPDQKLILFGDANLQDTAAKQKAIWQRWPENKIFLANYIIYLRNKNYGKTFSRHEFNQVLGELQKAKQLDPENAFYNYIKAAFILNKAVDIDSKQIPIPGQEGKYDYETEITAKDLNLLAQGMREFKAGLSKPFCRDHVMDMAQIRADIACRESKNISDQINRISIYGDALMPNMNDYMTIGKIIPYYAEMLAKSGNKQEAEFYLNAWKTYVKQINNGADTLLAMLVINSIIKTQAKQVSEIYRMLGEPQKAKKAEQELQQAAAVVTGWKNKIHNLPENTKKQLKRQAGLLSSILLPAIVETFDAKILTSERMLNYVIAEKFQIAMICLAGLMIITITLLFMVWNYLRGERSFLFVPSLHDFLKIIIYGIVLPLTVYFIISRLPWLNGREYNVFYNMYKFVFQSMLFIIGMPVAMIITVTDFVRQRCRMIGIDIPHKSQTLIISTCFIGAAILLLSVSPVYADNEKMDIFIILLILITVIIAILASLLRLLLMSQKYSRYKMTIYVNLIPSIILAILTVSLLVRPYLDHEETRLIQDESGIFSKSGFTKIENHAVEKLKTQLKQVMDKLPDQI